MMKRNDHIKTTKNQISRINKLAGIVVIVSVATISCLRYYFIFWVFLPKYKERLATKLNENWLEYAMSMGTLFRLELFVWPLLIINFEAALDCA